MSNCNRRHMLMSLSAWGMTGCHLMRFESVERDQAPSVADSLKAAKADMNLMDGPRRVGMRVATVIAPFKDIAIDSSIWHTADEQVLSTEHRDLLRSNGLRIGLLRSALPAEVEELLRRSGPAGQSVEPLIVNQPINEPVKIATADSKPKATMSLQFNGDTQSKLYQEVSGFIRASAMTDNQAGVIMKITPELHHGDIKTHFKPTSDTPSAFEPAQLSIRTGQTEELFRELSTDLRVEEGHCLVIGADSEKENSLGWFLLTEPPTSDREMQQKMILIWAWNTHRDATLNVPAIVQSNSRERKEFKPLKTPSESATVAARPRQEKTVDQEVQSTAFVAKAQNKKGNSGTQKNASQQESKP